MPLPLSTDPDLGWPRLSEFPRSNAGALQPHMWMSTRRSPSPDLRAHGQPPFDDFNLGDHVGDDRSVVHRHRQMAAQMCGAEPVWLTQVHGRRVVRLSRSGDQLMADRQVVGEAPITADGSWTTEPGVACVVMVADCLPVLLAAPEGRGVAALHAGWRGLCGGVLEQGVAALCESCACDPADLLAWLGPCIGPAAFEVGEAVLQGFGVDPGIGHPAFVPQAPQNGQAKWLADLPRLARQRLQGQGLVRVDGGNWCTVSDPSRFFSFRRDGVTGRQAAFIWLQR